MTGETVLILDFGGQYKELIARRVREHGVYSEIRSCKMPVEEIRAMAPKGIIFTGGPDSVYRDDSPTCDKAVLELGIPVLGICYGMQLICHLCGGTVEAGTKREYGVFPITLDTSLPLFSGCTVPTDVLMSHTDLVTALPEGFRVPEGTHYDFAECGGQRIGRIYTDSNGNIRVEWICAIGGGAYTSALWIQIDIDFLID